jgi:hypothetical protein
VDLSTAPARLAGGSNIGAVADDAGFHRLGIFGGDVLTSTVQTGFGGGTVPGGWPNGRRFGDDVVDIACAQLLHSRIPARFQHAPLYIEAGHNDIYNEETLTSVTDYLQEFVRSASEAHGKLSLDASPD